MKHSPKWTKGLNINSDNLNLLEEKLGSVLHLGTGKDFPNRSFSVCHKTNIAQMRQHEMKDPHDNNKHIYQPSDNTQH